MADYARGERLRQLRDRTHQSQEAVAAALGVSTKSVRAWEHGGGIHWENAKRLGSFYGEDPETLVSRESSDISEPTPTAPTQLDRIEANTEQILKLLNRWGESEAADDTPASEEEAAAVAADAARLEAAIASRSKKAPGRSANPPAGGRRRHAS